GILEPVVVSGDLILDGRHRWKACKKLGIECPTKRWNGKGSELEFVISMNLLRRQLTASQKAAVASEAMPHFEKLAKKRQSAAGGYNPRSKANASGKLATSVGVNPQARQEAAAAFGAKPRYVQEAKKLREEAPQVFARVKAGEINMQDAKREAKAVKATETAKTKPWPEEERQLRKELEAGRAVVVNLQRHHHLVNWALSKSLLVRVDRASEWGNPFLLDKDGDRKTVIENYKQHYLPNKPSLMRQLGELKGMALGCH
ncbi:unnamed protein product, partial [marine sediment metagenome]